MTPHAIDPSKTAEFPDVPRNHWAYRYISQLAGNGILVGYPDGTFKGDVKMTRYEFATMLYRALQNGAPIDENMKRALNEFGPELQNIRLLSLEIVKAQNRMYLLVHPVFLSKFFVVLCLFLYYPSFC